MPSLRHDSSAPDSGPSPLRLLLPTTFSTRSQVSRGCHAGAIQFQRQANPNRSGRLVATTENSTMPTLSLHAAARMKLQGLFNLVGLQRNRKNSSLQKTLVKVNKSIERLEKAIEVEECEPKLKRLETRLKTNKRHREKAKMLIAELDQRNFEDRQRPRLSSRLPRSWRRWRP